MTLQIVIYVIFNFS